MALVAPSVVYFDLETRLSPDEIGWDSALKGNAGISALVIYDATSKWVYSYDSHCIDDAITHLESADIVVSWNGTGFDIPVIEGYAKRKLHLKQHYDLFFAFKKALGRPQKGSGMGPTAERTIGLAKIGSGADAPYLAVEGRFGELFNYCAHDVYVLKSLTKHVLEQGWLLAPDGSKVEIHAPELMKAHPENVV